MTRDPDYVIEVLRALREHGAEVRSANRTSGVYQVHGRRGTVGMTCSGPSLGVALNRLVEALVPELAS